MERRTRHEGLAAGVDWLLELWRRWSIEIEPERRMREAGMAAEEVWRERSADLFREWSSGHTIRSSAPQAVAATAALGSALEEQMRRTTGLREAMRGGKEL